MCFVFYCNLYARVIHRLTHSVPPRLSSELRWTHFATIGLGLWLASSPLIFGIGDADSVASRVATVTAERGLASIEWRAMALAWSDVASCLLIALFGILSLSKRTAWFGQWASCFAGLWLLFAPLVFWAPTAAVDRKSTRLNSSH